MHMASRSRRWTLEEFNRLPDDGNKYELIRGELFVTPAPTDMHETILARLTRILDPYVAIHNLGYVYRARAVIRVRDESEVEPDLFVRQPLGDPNGTWDSAPIPILVVEVASDSTRRRDRMQKRTLYADVGIPEYWMVDADDRTIRIVKSGSDDLHVVDTLTWHPDGPSAPLSFALDHVFGSPRRS